MPPAPEWQATNKRILDENLERLIGLLHQAGRGDDVVETRSDRLNDPIGSSGGSAIDVLARRFGLSGFERDILLLTAGIEFDSRIGPLCERLIGGRYATFGLALAALPNPHWSALLPVAPLRRWNLIKLSDSNAGITRVRLQVDERVLHFLAGLPYLEFESASVMRPLMQANLVADVHRRQAGEVARHIERWAAGCDPVAPVIQLLGRKADRDAVLAVAAAALNLTAVNVHLDDMPTNRAAVADFVKSIERDAILGQMLVTLDIDGYREDIGAALHAWMGRRTQPLVIGGGRQVGHREATAVVEIDRIPRHEAVALWKSALPNDMQDLDDAIDELVVHFDLDGESMLATAQNCLSSTVDGEPLPKRLRAACRRFARLDLDALAQRIETQACWDDVVLPQLQNELLAEIVRQVKTRATVYDKWGFGSYGGRGLGVTALFAGPSGTGKTLSAEILATALELELYRIDLAGMVSKYIGETEKNLSRIFDAAEKSGAILLFDEADALFGKRSDVNDSHDRYANIEINYLLQRMDTYRGVAVLTTNLKTSIDSAFMRRIRFVVDFPFPDKEQRAEIWKKSFPRTAPLEGIDFDKLARLNIVGGNIRNTALNAAFIAAGEGRSIQMRHLLKAAQFEYAKLEKRLSESEVAGWI